MIKKGGGVRYVELEGERGVEQRLRNCMIKKGGWGEIRRVGGGWGGVEQWLRNCMIKKGGGVRYVELEGERGVEQRLRNCMTKKR